MSLIQSVCRHYTLSFRELLKELERELKRDQDSFKENKTSKFMYLERNFLTQMGVSNSRRKYQGFIPCH